ncbi:hypothetical protein ACFLWY_00905 [Chloroflexota bacterium]
MVRDRFPRYPNLIKGMVISRLNQVWLSDITYIRIRTGFVYTFMVIVKLPCLIQIACCYR